MTTKRVFVIKNQHNQYLDKHSDWLSGKDSHVLFRADHHDQALNTLLETNSKDITLRGRIIEVEADEKKNPIVDVSEDALALDKSNSVIVEDIIESPENDDALDEDIDIVMSEPEETTDEIDD